MPGHFKILAEWRGRSQTVLAERDVSGNRANRTPYRVQIIETHRFKSEQNAMEFCRKEFGLKWQSETK